MAFSVVGIQAHFSKTLLLFFIPQIFNFLLSCPQLFGIVDCPRHRLPRSVSEAMDNLQTNCTRRFDRDTNLLHPSKTEFKHAPSRLTEITLRTLAGLGLTELTTDPKTGNILKSNNLTILNFFLLRLGPMTEKQLCQVLMLTQVCAVTKFV